MSFHDFLLIRPDNLSSIKRNLCYEDNFSRNFAFIQPYLLLQNLFIDIIFIYV